MCSGGVARHTTGCEAGFRRRDCRIFMHRRQGCKLPTSLAVPCRAGGGGRVCALGTATLVRGPITSRVRVCAARYGNQLWHGQPQRRVHSPTLRRCSRLLWLVWRALHCGGCWGSWRGSCGAWGGVASPTVCCIWCRTTCASLTALCALLCCCACPAHTHTTTPPHPPPPNQQPCLRRHTTRITRVNPGGGEVGRGDGGSWSTPARGEGGSGRGRVVQLVHHKQQQPCPPLTTPMRRRSRLRSARPWSASGWRLRLLPSAGVRSVSG